MGRLSHHEVEELLGAYALDAVDADEAAEVEDHLAECPRCQAELTAHREVAGLFAYAGQTAPAGLWDRITASMQEAPPELHMDRLRPSMVTAQTMRSAQDDQEDEVAAAVVALDQRRRRRRNVGMRTFVASLAAAAAVAAFIGVSASDNTHHAKTVAVTSSASVGMREVRQALAEKGSRQIVMRPVGSTGVSLDAVVTPSGASYLYHSQLTPLGADRTYQLWGVVGQEQVSYGVIGNDPSGVIPFRAGTGVDALAVTDEVSSGVVTTGHLPVATGAVTPSL